MKLYIWGYRLITVPDLSVNKSELQFID